MKTNKLQNFEVVHVASQIAVADFIMLKPRYIPLGLEFPYGKYIEERKNSICKERGLNPDLFDYRFSK